MAEAIKEKEKEVIPGVLGKMVLILDLVLSLRGSVAVKTPDEEEEEEEKRNLRCSRLAERKQR